MGRPLYTVGYLRKLIEELDARHGVLLSQLAVPCGYNVDRKVTVDGMRIRLAVGDYNSILNEIKKLKG